MSEPLLEVRHLSKRYGSPRRGWGGREDFSALEDVSFTLQRSSVAALMGASGAGKTTLVRCLCSLERPNSGEIRFEGLPLTRIGRGTACRAIQMIFQDPGASLNPNFTAAEIIAEPLRLSPEAHTRRETTARAAELMDRTGLPREWSRRRAWQFSGGQRARLAIARALAVSPRLLILDESLSGLDVSVRGQIVNLLLDLQRMQELSYLLITHDVELAAGVAERVLLLQAGRLSNVTASMAGREEERTSVP